VDSGNCHQSVLAFGWEENTLEIWKGVVKMARKECPFGKKHWSWKRYCYHEARKVGGQCPETHTGPYGHYNPKTKSSDFGDDIMYYHVWDFKEAEYVDLFFPGDGYS
jgi:hypothetical protein